MVPLPVGILSFQREINIIFPTDKIIAKIRPFGKGKRSTFFLYQKEKSSKKEVGKPAV